MADDHGGHKSRAAGPEPASGISFDSSARGALRRRLRAGPVILGLPLLGCARGAPPKAPDAIVSPATPATTPAPVVAPPVEPTPKSTAADCRPDSVTVEVVGIRFGKPPLKSHLVDLHILNPLPEPAWVVMPFRVDRPAFGPIWGVEVYQLSADPPAHVWTFQGMNGFRAIRLPPNADIELRGQPFQAWWEKNPASATFPAKFVRSLRMDGSSIDAWVGGDGWTAPRGTFGGKAEWVSRWRRERPKGSSDFPESAAVEMDVICTIDVNMTFAVP